MEIFRSLSRGFFASYSVVLDWIVLILVWFERSLHSAQVSEESCPWPLKLMTSQRVERTWICTGRYGRFRDEWVKALGSLQFSLEQSLVIDNLYNNNNTCRNRYFVKTGLFFMWGARVAQWWEHSPPTDVARVQIPALTPYVGWVCCWFFPLLQEVFLWVLRVSPLLKNQHFQIPIRPGIR